jgi:hypothetical protein
VSLAAVRREFLRSRGGLLAVSAVPGFGLRFLPGRLLRRAGETGTGA